MENIDYFKVLAVIGTVLTFILTYFNKEHKRYTNLKDKYFKNILVPYINEYRKNKSINSIKFLKRNYKYDECFIPPYILYMVENYDKEDLHRVLIQDYKENFPSSKNCIWNTVNKISRIVDLITIFIFIILAMVLMLFIFNVALIILMGLINHFIFKSSGIAENDLVIYIGVIIFCIFIMFGLRYIVQKGIILDDEYSNKMKTINSNINKKMNIYKKNIDKEYLI